MSERCTKLDQAVTEGVDTKKLSQPKNLYLRDISACLRVHECMLIPVIPHMFLSGVAVFLTVCMCACVRAFFLSFIHFCLGVCAHSRVRVFLRLFVCLFVSLCLRLFVRVGRYAFSRIQISNIIVGTVAFSLTIYTEFSIRNT